MGSLSRYLAALLVLLPFASAGWAGEVYSAEMEKFGRKTSFEVWTKDTRAKFSVSHSDDPSMPAGMTVIALDRGDRYIILMPDKGVYLDLTKEQFRSLKGKQAQENGFQFQSGKLEELIVDEDGGSVAGIQTRHYKIKISVAGVEQGKKVDIVAVEEFWTAPSIPNPASSLDMLTEQNSGIAELDSLMAYKKLRGYPLKRMVQLSVNGQSAGSSRVEVRTIFDTTVPDSVFEVPANFKKLEVPGPDTPKK
jgi:Domain of unknown function (DUF4412)